VRRPNAGSSTSGCDAARARVCPSDRRARAQTRVCARARGLCGVARAREAHLELRVELLGLQPERGLRLLGGRERLLLVAVPVCVGLNPLAQDAHFLVERAQLRRRAAHRRRPGVRALGLAHRALERAVARHLRLERGLQPLRARAHVLHRVWVVGASKLLAQERVLPRLRAQLLAPVGEEALEALGLGGAGWLRGGARAHRRALRDRARRGLPPLLRGERRGLGLRDH
jgi:hypothetical protein